MITVFTGHTPQFSNSQLFHTEAIRGFAAAPIDSFSRAVDLMTPGILRSPLIPKFLSTLEKRAHRSRRTITIPGGMTFVHNPAAGNNAGGKYANNLRTIIESATNAGRMIVEGPIRMIKTNNSRVARISLISEYLDKLPDLGWHYMMVVGGDSTFADVVTAVVNSGTTNRVVLVPMMGGTANDAPRMHGANATPNGLLKFLRHAKPHRLDVGKVWINGFAQQMYLTQSLTFGVSGELFSIMERRRNELKGGRFKNLHYVPTLVREILKTKHFIAKTCGKAWVTGEVIVTGSTGLGGISTLPLKEDGFMTYLIPVDPKLPGVLSLTGSITLGEVVVRRIIGAAGFKEFALAGDILTLAADRQIPIPKNESLEIEVEGNMKAPNIRAVLNGDVVEENVEHVFVRSIGRPVTTLALPDSELAIRQSGSIVQ